ncbi:MAG TPA: hypothetical protein VHC90_25965 [Bryobacteraceae bacterium]|nr:hypothetical protein [Bryobacteraceae bacterium]
MRKDLSDEELRAMWRRLGRLSSTQLLETFHRVHEACRMRGDRMPPAAAMRELIMIWHLAQAWEEREQPRMAAVA